MSTSTDRIRLIGIQFYAHHGALQEERSLGQIFEVDVDAGGDFTSRSGGDDLHWTVDYTLLYREVSEIFSAEHFSLLETCAEAIASGLLKKFPVLQDVIVRVRKPHVPMGGIVRTVEVEVSRRRHD